MLEIRWRPWLTAVAYRGDRWRDAVRADLGAAAAELAWAGHPPPHDAGPRRRSSPAALLWVVAGLVGAAAAAAARFGLPGAADRLATAGLLAVALVAAGSVVQRRERLRWETGLCVLTRPADRAAFDAAVADTERIRRCWPTLDRLADPADPRPVLARALWGLAHALRARGRLHGAVRALSRVAGAVPETDPSHRALADRIDRVRADLAAADADARRRLRQLRRLATVCQQHADRCAARARARTTVRAAEALRHQEPPVPPASACPAAELAERIEAVVHAYRELAADLDVH